VPDLTGEPAPPRKQDRFMADAARYGWLAMRRAIDDAALAESQISHPRTGLVVGSGNGSAEQMVAANQLVAERGIEKLLPYSVPQVMGSTVAANLSTAFGIQGVSYGMTSACATSAHCIGHAAELIQLGKQDLVFAGGAEEVGGASAVLFDAMGVLASSRNDVPESASRPYDTGRDGFAIAGGAAVLVLESLKHALARKANIYAELVGYGATCDGVGMVHPGGDGAERAMRLALLEAKLPASAIDYVNTHATGTPQGDPLELLAMQQIFGVDMPPFSSTKGLTGHAIGASGALELSFCLLMMREGFVAGAVNIDQPDVSVAGLPLLRATRNQPVQTVLCNSFGFGGTNAALVVSTANL
jgi:3-oxoacyl-[acyl-carrier-protein] synthase-1